MDKNQFYFSLDITKSGNSGSGFFIEGYAATSDLDRQGEIVAISALQGAAANLMKYGNTVFFNHDYNRCVGKLEDVKVDDIGLWVKIYISKWEEELRNKIEEGIVSKFSIGGRVLSGERLTPKQAKVRFNLTALPAEPVTCIDAMELFEVSVVGLPANARAEFAHKSLKKALFDSIDIEKTENLGQIPDVVKDDKLPKPIAKELDTKTEELMEKDINTEIVPETKVEIEKTEVPVETKVETVATSEVPVETTKQEEAAVAPTEVVRTESVVADVKVTSKEEDGKFVEITEISRNETVKVEGQGQVVTMTDKVQEVRTFTIEEVNAIRDGYQKELDAKETMIKTLTAEVDNLKIEKAKVDVTPLSKQLEQITQNLSALNAKAKEIVIETIKSTPLAVTDNTVPLKAKEIPVDPDKGFLKYLKR